MEDKVLHVLEFHKILQLLAAQTTCEMGKELVQKLRPTADFASVSHMLAETRDAESILLHGSSIPLGGIVDITAAVKHTQLGAVLSVTELLAVAGNLYAARRLHRFFQDLAQPNNCLAILAAGLTVVGELENKITVAIDAHGEISDQASAELAAIRRELRLSNQRVKDKLSHILHSGEYQKYLQEALVTIRSDRYVIPVKQEYRQHFPGIVHDQSASGATLFIEPMAVVNLNNEIKRLAMAEQHEVQRILKQLSGQVALYAEVLLQNGTLLAQLDFCFAKGRLALDMRASMPILKAEGGLVIRQGRHPLLTGPVVPIDISLGKEFQILVITGPNTGGKTVSLKTVGLFALMTQAGLFIPASAGSEMPIFQQIYADIGDEQSIEQSLSTFSAHMTNLVHILGQVTNRDLVVMDEIGAGTDPDEGAALAMAILEFLQEKGVATLATTHYSELKTFAYTRHGIENASVEFDVATLKPTYRLLIGMPGSSNAFAITTRLGLADSIIDKARTFLSHEHVEFEEVLASLHALKKEYRERSEELESRTKELALEASKVQRERGQLNSDRDAVLNKAKAEARETLSRVKKETRALVETLKEQFQETDAKSRQRVVNEARQKIRELQNATSYESVPDEGIGEICTTVAPGDTVYITNLGQKGTVLSAPDRSGEVLVQAGILKVTVAIRNCRLLHGAVLPKTVSRSRTDTAGSLAHSAARELDLRGMTVEEGAAQMDKFLDDALLAGLNEVVIIHGKGTGALRKGIREILHSHPRAASIRPGDLGEGGDGVTVVRIR